jgi:2-keto-4-pentenoate hydratase
MTILARTVDYKVGLVCRLVMQYMDIMRAEMAVLLQMTIEDKGMQEYTRHNTRQVTLI